DRELEAQLVQFATRVLELAIQLFGVQGPQLFGLHLSAPVVSRKRVLIGSLAAANRIASLATSWFTPPISKSTRPGLTTATQPSGLPLPDPMRVSAGFFVTGLSGKIRIQIWPPRLT